MCKSLNPRCYTKGRNLELPHLIIKEWPVMKNYYSLSMCDIVSTHRHFTARKKSHTQFSLTNVALYSTDLVRNIIITFTRC